MSEKPKWLLMGSCNMSEKRYLPTPWSRNVFQGCTFTTVNPPPPPPPPNTHTHTHNTHTQPLPPPPTPVTSSEV